MNLNDILKKLEPELIGLEQKRLKALAVIKFYKPFRSIAAAFGFLLFLAIYIFKRDVSIYIIGTAFLFISIYLFTEKRISTKKKTFNHEYNGRVLRKVIQTLYPGLKLHKKDKFIEQKLMFSKIFKSGYDNYESSELIKGEIGQTICEVSHVTLTINSNKSQKTIFQGIFFVADFNKHFHGETIVLPDTLESQFGNLGKHFQKMNSKRDELVYFEHTGFEKEFAVYSTDQVEARYILSTSLIERLFQLKTQHPESKIYLSFIKSKVFIAMEKNDFLSIDINESVLENQSMIELIDEIESYLELVDILNLNNRIWTKK